MEHMIHALCSMITTEKILLELDPEINNLLPALKKISAHFGYVGEKDAQKVADYFSAPLSKVYEIATFYDLVKTKKEPDLVIQICSGTNCTVNNAFSIIREIENRFRIKAGDEFNHKVKLEIVSCLGQCGEGPIVVINGEIFTNVTASGVHGILERYV